MNKKPTPKTGIRRIWAAMFYSLQGLRHAIINEAAFRQEAILVVLALILLLFLPLSLTWKAVLFFATCSILIVELLNSAIESVVDLVSPEYHELAKRAKDFGSAAVLLCLVMIGVVWAIVLLPIILE